MNTPQQLAARITACLAQFELTEQIRQQILDVLFDCREFLEDLADEAKEK